LLGAHATGRIGKYRPFVPIILLPFVFVFLFFFILLFLPLFSFFFIYEKLPKNGINAKEKGLGCFPRSALLRSRA